MLLFPTSLFFQQNPFHLLFILIHLHLYYPNFTIQIDPLFLSLAIYFQLNHNHIH
jgi:hypothetical protein